MLSRTARGLLRPLLFPYRAFEGVLHRLERIPPESGDVKSAGWNPTAPLRSLLARLGVAELVYGELALESVNGALRDGAA